MLRRIVLSAAISALLLGQGRSGRADAPKPSAPAVSINVDVSEVPDLKEWAEKAKGIAETWYPIITRDLETEGYTPPTKVTISFKDKMEGVAGTSGDHIDVSARWVREHPDDFGMVIHEITHVVQSYPKYRPSWVVEGIADYIRYWKFEPSSPARRFDPKHSTYRSGYQPAAAFLVWLDETKHKGIIRELNQALRDGTCTEGTIKNLAGKPVDRLWLEFLEARQGGPRKPAAPKGDAASLPSPLGEIGTAPAFALTDSSGQPFTLSSLRGKAVVVSFIFTTCNGSCPATTHNLYRVQQTLKDARLWGKRVEFVSISLDPSRDTPDVLANYARIYNADPSSWHFLTGSPTEVAKVIDSWGMWVKPTPAGSLDHPSRIFLVDPQGKEREIYSLEFLKPENVLEDVKVVLAEGNAL